MKMNMNLGNVSKLLFGKVDNVVYDFMNGVTAIRKDDGLYSLNKDDVIEQNVFDMAMEVPAFYSLIPSKDVKRGDIIVYGNGKPEGFVLDPQADKSSIQIIKLDGTVTNYRPRKVSLPMFGIDNSVSVVRNMLNMVPTEQNTSGSSFGGNMMQMIMSMQMMQAMKGDGKMDMQAMMPMMFMSGMVGNGDMANMAMMMSLMGAESPFA